MTWPSEQSDFTLVPDMLQENCVCPQESDQNYVGFTSTLVKLGTVIG